MNICSLAGRSLWNRRQAAILVTLSIALSVVLLLGVERLRHAARTSFTSTLSGTDLIVGARGAAVNLLLYSVFRLGDATSNVSWRSVLALAERPEVAWTVPLSLGDSHRGRRVLGTTSAYFTRYRYRDDRPLAFSAGRAFDDLFDAVLGAEVAARFGYAVGDRITLAHGAGHARFTEHADKPFVVRGILAPTGTPVDRTVHVSLEAIEAIHADWFAGGPVPGLHLTPAQVRQRSLTPKAVTAVLVGLKSRTQVFGVQRAVNEFDGEPLMAILPGLTLQQLWDVLAIGERVLLGVATLVAACGLMSMLTALMTGLDERRREMAILRALGARPRDVFALLFGEALLLTLAGIVVGCVLLQLTFAFGLPLLSEHTGLALAAWPPTPREVALLGAMLAAGALAGLWPALRVHRLSLADGLTLRL